MTHLVYREHIPESPIGSIHIAATDRGVLAIEIGVEPDLRISASLMPGFRFSGAAGPFPVGEPLRAYLAGRRTDFDLPIDWRGMRPFQKMVLEAVAARSFESFMFHSSSHLLSV